MKNIIEARNLTFSYPADEGQPALPENLKKRAKIETGETCIPVTDGGYLLPSGASVRVTFGLR